MTDKVSDRAKALIASGVKLDEHIALELLKEVAEAKGFDYVYVHEDGYKATMSCPNACRNVHFVDGEPVPGCIVGGVFALLFGVQRVPTTGSAFTVNARLGHPFTTSGNDVLQEAQYAQDKGMPWGESIAIAGQRMEKAKAKGYYL